MNYIINIFLSNDLFHNSHLKFIINTQIIKKVIENNIILFENNILLVKSISFAQIIFQKLKWFAGNDWNDIRVIVSHLLNKGKLQRSTPEAMLEYLMYLKIEGNYKQRKSCLISDS